MYTPDSDVYPSDTFIDPLVFPIYVRTNDSFANDIQCREDWLLSAYLEQLNGEIADEIEEFEDRKGLVKSILYNVRAHGWCVVQFYEDEQYRVFSSLEMKEWITEIQNNRKVRVGFKAQWRDDLGNTFEDSVFFNENGVYSFIWEEGSGRSLPDMPSITNYAIPDVSHSILALSIQIRQILSTLTFSATNPFFYHLKYGDSITPEQRSSLISQMSHVSVSKAVGAKESMLKEIVPIENSAIDQTISALQTLISFFAGATRMPLSFYLGERQSGGLGDTGESTDEVKIMKKKDYILSHVYEELSLLFSEQYGIVLPDLKNYYKSIQEENKKKKNKILNKSKNMQGNVENEEGIEGID